MQGTQSLSDEQQSKPQCWGLPGSCARGVLPQRPPLLPAPLASAGCGCRRAGACAWLLFQVPWQAPLLVVPLQHPHWCQQAPPHAQPGAGPAWRMAGLHLPAAGLSVLLLAQLQRLTVRQRCGTGPLPLADSALLRLAPPGLEALLWLPGVRAWHARLPKTATCQLGRPALKSPWKQLHQQSCGRAPPAPPACAADAHAHPPRPGGAAAAAWAWAQPLQPAGADASAWAWAGLLLLAGAEQAAVAAGWACRGCWRSW